MSITVPPIVGGIDIYGNAYDIIISSSPIINLLTYESTYLLTPNFIPSGCNTV